jgi:hypothetical protein
MKSVLAYSVNYIIIIIIIIVVFNSLQLYRLSYFYFVFNYFLYFYVLVLTFWRAFVLLSLHLNKYELNWIIAIYSSFKKSKAQLQISIRYKV